MHSFSASSKGRTRTEQTPPLITSRRPGASAIVFMIRVYQVVISPWLGQHCRFHPSCSSYAIEAVDTHGTVKGCYLALRRLARCHPWHPGGADPVPPACHRDH